MTRSPLAAVAAARFQSEHGPIIIGPDGSHVGWCKWAVRRLYDVPSDGSASAAEAYFRTKLRHAGGEFSIPIGVPVWWTGGRNGHGHVAISAGRGKVWSTDIKRGGYFDLVPIDEITTSWGLRFEGWSEDMDGVRVWEPAQTRGPHIDRAIQELELAKGGPRRLEKIRRALRVLRSIAPRTKVTK